MRDRDRPSRLSRSTHVCHSRSSISLASLAPDSGSRAIPYDGLMSAIEERFVERHVLKLLRAMLRAGVMQGGLVTRSASRFRHLNSARAGRSHSPRNPVRPHLTIDLQRGGVDTSRVVPAVAAVTLQSARTAQFLGKRCSLGRRVMPVLQLNWPSHDIL
jgi:hypothetical protein